MRFLFGNDRQDSSADHGKRLPQRTGTHSVWFRYPVCPVPRPCQVIRYPDNGKKSPWYRAGVFLFLMRRSSRCHAQRGTCRDPSELVVAQARTARGWRSAGSPTGVVAQRSWPSFRNGSEHGRQPFSGEFNSPHHRRNNGKWGPSDSLLWRVFSGRPRTGSQPLWRERAFFGEALN